MPGEMNSLPISVIPAKAGIHCRRFRIKECVREWGGTPKLSLLRRQESSINNHLLIPAYAGMTK